MSGGERAEPLQQQSWDKTLRECDAGAAVPQLDSEYGASAQEWRVKGQWGYFGASHTSCPDSNKGIGAYVFMSGGAPVSWASKRVGNGSLSSCEIEYMGLTLAAQEACYLGDLRAEMHGVIGKKREVKCIDLLTDSQSAKSLAENPVYYG